MSNLNSNVTRIYGGAPSGDVVVANEPSPQNQGIPEVLVVGTYRRAVMGPKKTGQGSINIFNDVAGGAGSTASIYYSLLPNPSLASDADWVLDTTFGASGVIDMTILGAKLFLMKETFVPNVMVKVVVAASSASVRVFTYMNGTNV